MLVQTIRDGRRPPLGEEERLNAAMGLTNVWQRFSSVVSGRPRRLIGLSMLRIFVGGTAALYMLSDYSRRHVLWGPHRLGALGDHHAVMDFWGHQAPLFDLYSVFDSRLGFEILFHLGLVVCLFFAAVGGRLLALAHAVLFLSLCNRGPELLEGGENLTRILVVMLPLVYTSGYLSPLASATHRRIARRVERRGWFVTAVHNVTAGTIVFQISVVYFVSGLWKVIGKPWYNGTALYYILNTDQFNFFGLFTHVMNMSFVTTVTCYVAILIEIAFPWFVATRHRRVRELGVALVELMHVGILVGMGLVVFGLIMIGADLAVLTDGDYRAFRRWCGRLARPRSAVQARTEPAPGDLAELGAD